MADSTKTEELRPERLGDQLRPERLGDQLRPERLGERLQAERIQSRLKAERIQHMLADLPGWEAAEDGGALERTYLFPTLRAAVAFVALVAETGEANGYVPDIDLRHLEVTLRVSTHAGAGLTALDFEAARLFDQRL